MDDSGAATILSRALMSFESFAKFFTKYVWKTCNMVWSSFSFAFVWMIIVDVFMPWYFTRVVLTFALSVSTSASSWASFFLYIRRRLFLDDAFAVNRQRSLFFPQCACRVKASTSMAKDGCHRIGVYGCKLALNLHL
jgi:hypothetical protein